MTTLLELEQPMKKNQDQPPLLRMSLLAVYYTQTDRKRIGLRIIQVLFLVTLVSADLKNLLKSLSSPPNDE